LDPRFARERLEEALTDTPVVLVHGPRQCGKTTFGTDRPASSRFVERILTTLATLKALDHEPFAFLVEAQIAHAAGEPAPSLLLSPPPG
jgi:predicted AAA+ superfamily ATPase